MCGLLKGHESALTLYSGRVQSSQKPGIKGLPGGGSLPPVPAPALIFVLVVMVLAACFFVLLSFFIVFSIVCCHVEGIAFHVPS
jgi:hypothetical protein